MNTLALEDLLAGKAHAFVGAHSAGMLELVSSEKTIKADMVPETLLFDVHRLGRLQQELQELVTATTILVSVGHELAKTKDVSLVAVIAEEVFLPAQELDLMDITNKISTMLEQRSSLTAEARKSALRSLTQCSSPTDAVHVLM
jgi:hypothetical protein